MLVFDIETNGLLETVDKLFCISIYDTEAKRMDKYDPLCATEGVKRLFQALTEGETIAGHNIIGYDIPCLQKLCPNEFPFTREHRRFVFDTLIASRLIYANLDTLDLGLLKTGKLPKVLYKSHSLKAWGYRLGELKGTYGEQEDAWDTYTPEMLDYNEQDVIVSNLLLEKILEKEYSQTALDLEHEVAWLIADQERNGYPFDRKKAEELEKVLRIRHYELKKQIEETAPPIPDKLFIPKRDNKKLGYVKGVPIQRYKTFNSNSRQQIDYLLKEHFNYQPDNEDLYERDEDGHITRLKIDETTLTFISNDEQATLELRHFASLLNEGLLVSKRLGQLADGNNAWLSMIKPDGRIHGCVITNGAVTGRATHSNPNVAQVPAVSAPYGTECRELFNAGGWTQVGVDASGLELRCLAHYMHPYDGGEYAHEILNGDIHTKNQINAGLPTRNNAKTFIYGFLYGAGDAKIGSIIKGTKEDGKRIKKKFLEATPAIKKLKQKIEETLVEYTSRNSQRWKRRYLRGLDGRKLHVRSTHSALNLLLQSAGAIICKKWIVRTEERMIELGYKHGWDGDFAYMAWVHDEIQVACRTEEIARVLVEEAQKAMRDTQDYFDFRVQLDTEGKIGKNWRDCH